MQIDPVARQYEAYPYPDRKPEDEAGRLITGSPSHPVEIDHFLFGGRRDWSQPFRVLVAGGGTGDSLVMLAQVLSDIGCPAELTYLDRSQASRAIAEARMAARGLSARFVSGDIAQAPELGPFDYIDCVGVVHHLEDPAAGLRALATALAPEGGMGLAVYAPHGRAGVYAMQDVFGALLSEDDPAEQVSLARQVVSALPATNGLSRNPFVGDHKASDAGLYDLLLHARDRAYEVPELAKLVRDAGLEIVSMLAPARYDPLTYLPRNPALKARVERLDPVARMAVAERLTGNIKIHIAYLAPEGTVDGRMAVPAPDMVPHLAGATGPQLAGEIVKRGELKVNLDGLQHRLDVDRRAAPLLSWADGKRTLAEVAAAGRLDADRFDRVWAPVHRSLSGFNFLHYSKGARR